MVVDVRELPSTVKIDVSCPSSEVETMAEADELSLVAKAFVPAIDTTTPLSTKQLDSNSAGSSEKEVGNVEERPLSVTKRGPHCPTPEAVPIGIR